MTTGEKIYELRKKARITQEEFAEKMDITRQAVSKWESDTAYPETDKIIKIAELFGVSCDYLLKENQTINEGVCGKQRRAFLSMMISFSVACTVLGLVIAFICYFAVREWYSSLIGLCVLAGLTLAAFILFSVGRYRFLLECDYSEADKKHLAIWTKVFLYTAVIALCLYLPSVVFIELEGNIQIGNEYLTYTYYRKLNGVEFVLSEIVYGTTGYLVANVLNFAHEKILGKKFTPVKFTDAVCVTVCVLAGVIAYSVTIYKNYEYTAYEHYAVILCFATVFCAAVIAQTVVHRIYEKTPVAIVIFQTVCAVLFFAISLTAYISALPDEYRSPFYVTSLALGGILFACSVAMIIIAGIAAGKQKEFKQIMLIRLSVLTYIIFGALFISGLYFYDLMLVLLTMTVYAPVAALLHAPFIKEKNQ